MHYRRAFLFLALVLVSLVPSIVAAGSPRRQPPPDPITAETLARELLAIEPRSGLVAPPVQPASRETLRSPISALERAYTVRAGEPLRQFGYDLFDHGVAAAPSPIGAVQDDFILGVGDEVTLVLRGQRNETRSYPITTEGLFIAEQLRPIPGAGRTLGELRRELTAEIRSTLLDTEVFLSLTSVRRIGVYVVGAVLRPGRVDLSAFGTVLDGLTAAGGVERNGSLRQVRVSRAGGQSRTVDLYQFLLAGEAGADIRLRDGDRIHVPAIGPTLAVGGPVKRPGIYELPAGGRPLTVAEATRLAGGLLQPAAVRPLRLRLAGGREQTDQVERDGRESLADGDILLFALAGNARVGSITLAGHVLRPGPHALERAPSLRVLLGDGSAVAPNVYPLLGVITRFDRRTLARQLIPFSPADVLAGNTDRLLANDDEVRLFSAEMALRMASANEPAEDPPAARVTARADAADNAREKPQREITSHDEDDPAAAMPVFLSPTDREFAKLLRGRAVTLRGAVARPGRYPIAEGGTVGALIAAAGGLTAEADPHTIEVTTTGRGNGPASRRLIAFAEEAGRRSTITPGDAVRVGSLAMALEPAFVTISGEVHHPGRYDVFRGERLSSLIARAGGLTEEAHAAGAMFLRESVRRREREQFDRFARDIERNVAAALSSRDRPNNDQVASARSLAADLRTAEPVGRITVSADPVILKERPDLDLLLEAGDRLIFPKRAPTVGVAGEVLSPAVLQFTSGKTARDYLREAGGFTYYADDDRTFVMFPDGSSAPLRVSFWRHEPVMVPPGSTIIVPRDPEPFDWMKFSAGLGGILSQLAISAVAIAAISND